ncbi:MAG: LysR family transcriptional regulator [Betaproteobacteria bacterium]
MNRTTPLRHRSLSVGPVRAFEAVSRTLNFRLAAEELHLTQSAVSRQVKALEDEVGARILERDTRGVRLTPAGLTLLQALGPWLGRIDVAVRQIRLTAGRQVVGIATFSSFASLWLLPRISRLQQRHGLDLRVLSRDQIVPAETNGPGRLDAVVRYCRDGEQPEGALRLFDEMLAPVASPRLLAQAARDGRAVRHTRDLTQHTCIEDLDMLPSTEHRSWFSWLGSQGEANLQPRQWLYFNMAHQQIEAAASACGLAIGRLPLIADRLETGNLREPFGDGARVAAPYAYWLIVPSTAERDAEHDLLIGWIRDEAAATRRSLQRPHGYRTGPE